MTHDTDPLLDDIAVCPKCGDPTHTSNLCEHDDPDTGPLCTRRCCEWWHGGRAAA